MYSSALHEFFDTVEWYGTPFVANFLTSHKNELEEERSLDIWKQKGFGFQKEVHIQILNNDFQYITGWISYSFAEPGAYEWVLNEYRKSILDILDAIAFLDMWLMFKWPEKMCFTELGITPAHLLTSDEICRLQTIYSHDENSPSAKFANYLLGEDFIHRKRLENIPLEQCYKMLGYIPRACVPNIAAKRHNSLHNEIKQKLDVMDKVNVEIYNDFTNAWNNLDAELIVKHLDDSFRYDSEWVFDFLDKDGYSNYIKGKFETIRKTGSKVIAKLGQNSMGETLIQLNQGGNIAFYRIKVVNGKVVKADLNSF